MSIAAKFQQRPFTVRHEMPPSYKKQSGIVLVIALIVMVAMTLASIAMVRSVDTSTLIAGNLAFKQSATASGEAGIEAALAWLDTNGSSLERDNPSSGYYATSQTCLDLSGNGNLPEKDCTPPFTVLDWSNAKAVKALAKDGAGNEVAYVIHRLCDTEGPLSGARCSTAQSAQEGGSLGSRVPLTAYQPLPNSVANRGYYRITVRIAGPRNTYSYVQAIASR